ncbi:MAG: glycosyltransferase family 2 protein [bacterium]|nr:glycosyltransferase family 2 protein [bacterium]
MASLVSAKPAKKGVNLKNFVLPTRYPRASFDFETAHVVAIIPTYKPEELTVKLVADLTKWNPHIRVIVVDDCTPQSAESTRIFGEISSISERVTLLRTPVNKLKAGALNHALEHIWERKDEYVPDVILSLDDDIVIAPSTIRNLVTELMSYPHLGAVCSQCGVLNKNKNFLTRLQGLEYLGFNATRLADEGFYWGPLVMHGMLTAFRVSALREVGKFAEGHLIEDYEMTSRLKTHRWGVKLAVGSPARTVVPESFSRLWRQRARWSYGGITVITKVKYFSAVLQDLIGHGVFFATVLTITLLLVFKGSDRIPTQIAYWVIMMSLLQLALWYGFQLWLMRLYKEKDRYDWLIRISIVPEFVYTNVLTVILMGSYLFLLFNILTHAVTKQSRMLVRRLAALGAALFSACGYTKTWGTRMN